MAMAVALLPGLMASSQSFMVLIWACVEWYAGCAASRIFFNYDAKVPTPARGLSRHSNAYLCSMCLTCRVRMCAVRRCPDRLFRSRIYR